MAHFARVNSNNIVEQVIVADQEFINSGAVGDPAQWIECDPDGAIRNVFPGAGWTYNPSDDNFYPPKPAQFPSWVWGFDPIARIWQWQPPVPCPGDPVRGNPHIKWDEATLSWVDNPDQDTWKLPRLWDAPEYIYDKVTQTMVENPVFDMLGVANPYKNQ
jgi:hypothetical protein